MLANTKKALFDNNQISNSNNKSKSAWNIFNQITNKFKCQRNLTLELDNNVVTDLEEISNLFNVHFTAVDDGQEFVSPLGDARQYTTIFLEPTDQEEIFRLLMNLPNKFFRPNLMKST